MKATNVIATAVAAVVMGLAMVAPGAVVHTGNGRVVVVANGYDTPPMPGG